MRLNRISLGKGFLSDVSMMQRKLIDSWIREKEKTGTFVQTESDPCENLTDKAEYVLARCSALPESNRLEKTGDLDEKLGKKKDG